MVPVEVVLHYSTEVTWLLIQLFNTGGTWSSDTSTEMRGNRCAAPDVPSLPVANSNHGDEQTKAYSYTNQLVG